MLRRRVCLIVLCLIVAAPAMLARGRLVQRLASVARTRALAPRLPRHAACALSSSDAASADAAADAAAKLGGGDDDKPVRVVDKTPRLLSENHKKVVAYRQRYLCSSCKCLLPPNYHVDHRVPLALGGTNGLSNLQALCVPCHHQKTRDQRHELVDARKLRDGIHATSGPRAAASRAAAGEAQAGAGGSLRLDSLELSPLELMRGMVSRIRPEPTAAGLDALLRLLPRCAASALLPWLPPLPPLPCAWSARGSTSVLRSGPDKAVAWRLRMAALHGGFAWRLCMVLRMAVTHLSARH